jgi:glutamate/tyrosine decarboxylase-like PLP-dependent enzyme
VLERALALAVEFLEGLPSRRVAPAAGSTDLLAALDRPVPEIGEAPEAVVEALARTVGPGLMAMPGGRFFGWVIGGALPASLAADWLTSVWDQNAGSAEGTPAAAACEQVALRWILELLDLPRHASAALVTGGQMANTVGLAAGRNHLLRAVGWDVEAQGLGGAPPISVVVGQERHDTVARSVRLLGLGEARMIAVAADQQGRLRPDALTRVLEAGAGPVLLCAQAGNVNTGAIDPLADIAAAVDAARARRPVWLHVDGAFGLWARASRQLAPTIIGVERADSWATDAHKWLNTPYDCGIALCAHPDAHRAAMGIRAAYLPAGDEPRVRAPLDFTPELSRRARGFALYAALAQLGRRGVAELVDRSCALARRFAAALAAAPGVTVLNEVNLNQVLVRFGGDDARTRRVVAAVQGEGTCYMSGTVWQGQAAMRISVCNWSTDEDDVDRSVAAILGAHRSG